MCTQRFTVLPDCNKEHWRCVLCMRLSSQTSVDMQTQHQDQNAFHGCRRPITKACPLCPGFPSRHRQRQRMLPRMAQDADNGCHTFETQKTRRREQGIKSVCTAYDLQRPPAQTGKPKHPAAPVQHTNRRTCSLDQQTLCTKKRVQRGSCANTRTRKSLSVHVRCHVADAIKTFPLLSARRVFKWTLYLIGHVTTLYFTEYGSVHTNN